MFIELSKESTRMRIPPICFISNNNQKNNFTSDNQASQKVVFLRDMSSQEFYQLMDGFGILVDSQDKERIKIFGFQGIKDYISRLVSVGLATTDERGRLYLNNVGYKSLCFAKPSAPLSILDCKSVQLPKDILETKTLEIINLLEGLAMEEEKSPLRVNPDSKAFERDLKRYVSPESLAKIEHDVVQEAVLEKFQQLNGHLLFLSQDRKRVANIQKLQVLLDEFNSLPLDDRAYQYITVNHVTKNMSSSELIYRVLTYMKYNIYGETANAAYNIEKGYNDAKYPKTVKALEVSIIDYLVKKAPDYSKDFFRASLVHRLKTNFNNAIVAMAKDANYDINSHEIIDYYRFVAKLIAMYKLDAEEPDLLIKLTDYYRSQTKLLGHSQSYSPAVAKPARGGNWKYGPGIQSKK